MTPDDAAACVKLAQLVHEVRWVIPGVKRVRRWVTELSRSGLVQRHEIDVKELPVLRSIRIASSPLKYAVTIKGPMERDEADRLQALYNRWSGKSGGGKDDE